MSAGLRITLEQHLEWLAMQGHDLRIRTPERYERLWERAREAGLRPGRLYVLTSSLQAHVGGSYHADTADIWVVHSDEEPEAGLRSLLHELAHARREYH